MTSWRAATDIDTPALEAFLLRHIDTSVFLVSNLRRFGPSGGTHGKAMRFWVTGTPINGVIAQSSGGTVLAQWPGAADWRAPLAVLDHPITGAIGDGDQMNAMLQAAGIRHAPTTLDADEVLMSLDLTDLVPQPGPGALRPITEDDRPTLIPWRRDYAINTLGEPEATASTRAEEEIAAYIADDSHRVLDDGGTLLSMTGFNATVDGLVQVGGVYTPPDLRGRGLARRALALHLQEARSSGATRALLFANDPSAIAAYAAVGFQPTGRFALIMFAEGQGPR